MPKVSVIMGIYNAKQNINVKNAIESIYKQTFQDFELIICDDGSTDNTIDYIQELTREDNRTVLISNKVNMGSAYSRNCCLKKAKCEYIAVMDSDDIAYPTRFEEEVKFLDENKEYDIVGCCAELINDNGVWGYLDVKEKPLKKDFLWNSQFIHPTVMIRNEAMKDIDGYRVAKETIRGQDYDLFMRLYAQGYIGYNIQKYLFQYREDKDGYKKRTYRHRLNEAKVRFNGFKAMKLLPIGYLYIIKPLIVGMIPVSILQRLKKGKE